MPDEAERLGFLSRWSRRKRGLEVAEPPPPVPEIAAEIAAAQTAALDAEESELLRMEEPLLLTLFAVRDAVPEPVAVRVGVAVPDPLAVAGALREAVALPVALAAS